jgi:F-type H+-transporting ATPase subunit a
MSLLSAGGGLLASSNITVGSHITRTIDGVTFNIDTIISTVVAGVTVMFLGFLVARRARAGVPNKAQLAWEAIIGYVEDQVESSIGPAGKPIVPLAVTLFVFILFSNWLEMLPTGHNPQYLPPPTGDINFTAAMAIFVIIAVHATWIARQGWGNYIAHYFKPFPILAPINFIEELVKPVTLALRLFGNIFAGGVLLLLIANLFPAKLIVAIPLGDIVWKLFDGLFVAPIQAFIFMLLTILYFGSAYGTSGH